MAYPTPVHQMYPAGSGGPGYFNYPVTAAPAPVVTPSLRAPAVTAADAAAAAAPSFRAPALPVAPGVQLTVPVTGSAASPAAAAYAAPPVQAPGALPTSVFRDSTGRVNTAFYALSQGRQPATYRMPQVAPPAPPGYSFPTYSPPTAYQFPTPQTAFDQQQVRQNYNEDVMGRMRGTLARVRRKAMLSKDPAQLSAYFALARSLGISPGFSAVGRQPERMARAEAKFNRDTALSQMFQPLSWLNQ